MVTPRTLPTIAIVFVASVGACTRPSVPVVTPAPIVAADPVNSPAPIEQQGTAASPNPYPPVAAADTKSDSVHVNPIEVSRRAAEVFGDSASLNGPQAAPAAATAIEPSWDIEVRSYESTDRVEHYVRMFTGPAKERIELRLARGTRYEPMIRAKLREGGLPEDMYYLALIESGFDPNAYSSAAAVGMWQFMTSTARDMGMRVDWWVDERRDPMKSTVAAVRFIKGLKEQFGSLYLAAAAYNGGPGRIARGLTRYADDLEGTTGDDLFFALAEKDYLRNETREYVPQLIAAALIAKEPDRYGMTIAKRAPISYDSVRVGPATPLAAVARAANSTVSDVQELNPQILRGITPPKDSFFVRIPAGATDSFPEAFAALPKSERTGLITMESKKGQNFASISNKTGISARQLALYNPKLRLLKSGNLAPGQLVLIPTEAVAAAAVPVPDPAIERYSAHTTAMHVVKSGETLSGIAKKYKTSSAALMKANGLKRALIFPGQSLVVRVSSKATTSSKTATSSKSSKSSATSQVKKTPAPKKKASAPAKKAKKKKSTA